MENKNEFLKAFESFKKAKEKAKKSNEKIGDQKREFLKIKDLVASRMKFLKVKFQETIFVSIPPKVHPIIGFDGRVYYGLYWTLSKNEPSLHRNDLGGFYLMKEDICQRWEDISDSDLKSYIAKLFEEEKRLLLTERDSERAYSVYKNTEQVFGRCLFDLMDEETKVTANGHWVYIKFPINGFLYEMEFTYIFNTQADFEEKNFRYEIRGIKESKLKSL